MKDLLKQFNETLKRLPMISEDLQILIKKQKWSAERTQQALEIIRQLKNGDVIEKGLCLEYSYINFIRAEIILTPKQCEINEKTFGTGNILKATEYIKNLLDDINHISEDVKFDLGGYYPKGNRCEFYIKWEF